MGQARGVCSLTPLKLTELTTPGGDEFTSCTSGALLGGTGRLMEIPVDREHLQPGRACSQLSPPEQGDIPVPRALHV